MCEDIPAMNFTVDAQGKIISVNRFGANQLGYEVCELIGHSVLEVFHNRDRKKILQQLNRCLQDPQKVHQWQFRKVHKDGRVIWVEESARAIKNRMGEWEVFLVCEDITARKQAETTIRESRNRYHVLFEEAPISLWELDMSKVKKLFDKWRREGIDALKAFFKQNPEAVEQGLGLVEILDVNQATLQLYQADSKEQLIANARQVWTAESRQSFTEEMILAISAGKTDDHFETSLQTLRGKKIRVWGQWHLMPDYEQSLSRVFVATLDITQQKKYMDKLRASRGRLRSLSAHLQFLREQERVAIARDLHDELGQALTSLKMDMSMLARKVKSAGDKFNRATVFDDIETMQARITGAIKYVRNLITELRPEVLDTLGLLPALGWQIGEFHKRTGMACEFNSEVQELQLGSEHAVAVFRIFQESLTNIVRHANANKVSAKIEKRNHTLWVEISDNGKGITREELNAPGKFGLLGMRERALLFGGEVEITGAPGQGTTVKIKVPLPA